MHEINQKNVGVYAEEAARFYLKEKGYAVQELNYRKPWGEMDIIAKRDGVTVFIEVKGKLGFRDDDRFEPHLRVDEKKRKALMRLAEFYLRDRGEYETPWQIDIMSVTFFTQEGNIKFRHYKNIII